MNTRLLFLVAMAMAAGGGPASLLAQSEVFSAGAEATYRIYPRIDPEARAAEVQRLQSLPAATIDANSANADSTLGDVIESLATSAGMSYIALPDGPLKSQKVTFHIVDTPWGSLQLLAHNYEFDLVFEEITEGHPVWKFMPLKPDELVTRTYVLTHNTHETTHSKGTSSFGSFGSGGYGGQNGSNVNMNQNAGNAGLGGGGSGTSNFTTDNPLTKQLEEYLTDDTGKGKKGFAKWITDSNTFLVRATAKQHHEIEDFLAKVDQDLPEIELNFTFVLVSDNPSATTGTNSSLLTSGLPLSIGGLSVPLNNISASQLASATLSTPSLTATLAFMKSNSTSFSMLTGSQTVLSNRDGSIQSVTELPIMQNTLAVVGNSTTTNTGVTSGQITYSPVGDIINFHAKRLGDHQIAMAIDIEVSNVASTTSVGGQSVPIVASQSYTTEAIIDEGMSLGMGGLESTVNAEALSKIPGLGDIPFFGFAFKNFQKSTTRSRLYLFITPHVLPGHKGAPFEPNRHLTPATSAVARTVFQAAPSLPLSAVSASLTGFPEQLATLEIAVHGGRGDAEIKRQAKLLANELDLMTLTVEENRLVGVTDKDLDLRLNTLRERCLQVVRNAGLPTLGSNL